MKVPIMMICVFGVFIYFSSKKIAKPIVMLAKNVDKIRNFEFDEPPELQSRISEIITLNSSLSAMRSALKSFSKYVPDKVVKQLISQGKDAKIGGEKE